MVVFDSSTLILLAKIEMVGLFIADFHDRVIIPEKVEVEVSVKGGEETPLISTLIGEGKIEVLKARHRELVEKLVGDFNIGAGEAEALALALQEGASVIATDDRNTIRACKALSLDFVTAPAFVVRAFEKHLIDMDEAILKIKKLKSIGRYSKAIIEDAIKRISKGGV